MIAYTELGSIDIGCLVDIYFDVCIVVVVFVVVVVVVCLFVLIKKKKLLKQDKTSKLLTHRFFNKHQ